VLDISTADARLLLMHGACLLGADRTAATPARTLQLVHDLGFVQIDSIHVVERAHHHILWSRAQDYEHDTLDKLQRTGRIFEHWTHDASLIPTVHFPHWRHRFARVAWGTWIKRMLGPNPQEMLTQVLDRITREGPLMASDFEHAGPRKASGWWDWKPAKAALDYLWRSGELAVAHRVNFQKVYDLTPRVLGLAVNTPHVDEAAHMTWACHSALERLGAATPTQIARFWHALSIAQAKAWCTQQAKAGTIVPVRVITVQGKAVQAWALPDITTRIARAKRNFAKAERATRVLNPFDPILRDRARCAALFGFDYRFEAFTPAPKRTYGYYVLPVLHADRLVARFDPQLDRSAGTFSLAKLHWEPHIPASERKTLLPAVEEAIVSYAQFCGAAHITMPTKRRR
jgi:uncharacterized protein YcaQ